MSNSLSQSELLALTSKIVSAHVSNNVVAIDELESLIQQIFQALVVVDTEHHNAVKKPETSVSIKDSVTDDYIICLEDGKKLKMLKRHLKASYDMTVEQYKKRWGLPVDYPVVAPNYAKRRSQIARTTGLGTKGRKPLTKEKSA
jgi:predicted transcriptional regulator